MPAWIHSDPHDDGYWKDAQRPCARGERCASRDHNGEPAQGPRVLCTADRNILHRVIEQLPELYLELWMRLGSKSNGGDGPRVSGGGKTPPTPINLGIEALMARFVEVLCSWEERVRIVARLDVSRLGQPRRHAVAIEDACRTLAAHLDALLALEPEPMNRSVSETAVPALEDDVEGRVRPAGWAMVIKDLDGGDAALEILALQAAVRSKLEYTPRHHDLLTPCWNPDCEQRMLRRWDGSAGMDDHVECRACGATYAGEQLQRLMLEEELAHQRRARKEAS